MNLWDMKPNEEGTILNIEKSCVCCDRLSSYGFIPGQTAKYLYKTALSGPRVYLLNDTVYSLSREVASQILIQTDAL